MNILEALQSFPYVKVILHDSWKTICSVRVTVERTEKIDSGSMMFHHPRYITFGQMIVFTKEPHEIDQGGALFFSVSNGEEAVEIINNIIDSFEHEKEQPDHSILIAQEI
jgi:hypothetical protein